jgi:hypothetical protein
VVIFRPFWEAPVSIARAEIIPTIERAPEEGKYGIGEWTRKRGCNRYDHCLLARSASCREALCTAEAGAEQRARADHVLQDGVARFYDDLYGQDAELDRALQKDYPYPH